MLKLLQAELENEISIYNKLIDSGRESIMATITMQKIELRIKQLERKINEQKTHGNDSAQCSFASGIICHVRENVRGHANNEDGSNCEIFAVSKRATPAEEEVA